MAENTVLVTGGGGYIGSFMTKALLEQGFTVFVLDNFSRGYKNAVDSRATILEGDILDKAFVTNVFSKQKFDAVIHFAGLIAVGESMVQPGSYFDTNVLGSINLLEGIKNTSTKFIFSSTAAVYGNPETIPIPENHSKNPTSPYGESKLMVEKILSWYNKIYGTPFAALRYFNASGAALDGSMGERHSPETHIIPKAIEAILENKPFTLFGTDYDTDDGTCVRDYIHVLDLIDAHMFALRKLTEGSALIYNVGTGRGYSNKEVLAAIEKVSGKSIQIQEEGRRPGDPARLVADPKKITSELSFVPNYSDIETIAASAWEWHSKNKS